MSVNTAHINGGVLIHGGECILIFSDKVSLEWNGQQDPVFSGTKKGRIYLTTHRMIFNSSEGKDKMQSFSFPFVTLSNVELEQPVFGANYIKGVVRAQPQGNWEGQATFKLTFKNGGAIEFGQAMLRAASLATRGANMNVPPPPYTPPQGQWYMAPPPAYAPPPAGYYGWAPPTHVFPQSPPQDGVFMTDAPPPYPGINTPQAGFGGPPGGFGAPQGGFGGPPGGFGAPQGEFGGPQGAFGGPQGAFGGAPNPSAPGFAKAAEAAQSAYYDPNQPQMAYVPPPAYYENPPSYQQATDKKFQ